jgi:hypothetical protein
MKQYQIFILALVFVGTLFSTFHVHEDAHESEDCQICILQHNMVGSDITSSTDIDKVELYFETPSYTRPSFTQKTYNYSLSRAPPSIS